MSNAIDKSTTYYAEDRAAWRKWLKDNHKASNGVWLIYLKKDSGKPRLDYAHAVEEALCFGWIDSTINAIDDKSYMQLFTPRKPKSGWSKLNKERVERLIKEKLMTPSGMEKIELARQHGTWDKLDEIEAFTIPPILKKAFAANTKAKKHFDTLGKTNKKYLLYHINGVKDELKKEARLKEIIDALNESRMPDRYVRKPKA